MEKPTPRTRPPRLRPSNDLDQLIRDIRQDAKRRDRAFSDVCHQIGIALRKILETPLLQHDEHCHNLVMRMARAGTMSDFADRLGDFQRHINRLGAGSIAASRPYGCLDTRNGGGAHKQKAGRFRIPI